MSNESPEKENWAREFKRKILEEKKRENRIKFSAFYKAFIFLVGIFTIGYLIFNLPSPWNLFAMAALAIGWMIAFDQ